MKIVENITWFSQLVGAKKTDLYEKYDLYGLYADLAIITKFENGETKSLYLPLKSIKKDQPHFKGSVASCGQWLPYLIGQLQNLAGDHLILSLGRG